MQLPSLVIALLAAVALIPRAGAAQSSSIDGVVFDSTTMAPLPGAIVYLSGTYVRAVSGPDGRFLLSNVPTGEHRLATASPHFDSLGVHVPWLRVTVPTDSSHISVAVHAPRATRAAVAQQPTTRSERPRELLGRVIDASTGAPVAGALVRLAADETAMTDANGQFSLQTSLRSGAVTVEHLAYGTVQQRVELGSAVQSVELRVTANAIELRPIEVTTSAERRGDIERTGTPGRIISPEVVDTYRERGATMEQILRDRALGLKVQRVQGRGAPYICVEGSRGPDRIQGGGGCNMVAVYLDDVRIHDAHTFFFNLSLDQFEEIQYLTPAEAGWRYGTNAGFSGVLLLRTRKGRR